MSTDMYGVRVLSVDPEDLLVRFRIFVVYYEAEYRMHLPAPDDPAFFFFVLWEGAQSHGPGDSRTGPLAELLDTKAMLDFGWVEDNARRYVSRVTRTAERNHPPTAEQWERIHDFYYERDGGWRDEDLLVQFDYEVRVTDRRWLEPLHAGKAWGTTIFQMHADTWTPEDAPHIPDLSAPAVALRPFDSAVDDLGYDSLTQAEFSDDGRYLAVCSDQNRVWVYDTADWTEVVRTDAGAEWLVPTLMWVPGRHVLTVKTAAAPEDPEVLRQWAFDVDTLAVTTAPFQAGHGRSRDGVHRIVPTDSGEGRYDLAATDRSPLRPISLAEDGGPIVCHSFAGDGSRLFLGTEQHLYVVDPATGLVADSALNVSTQLHELASSPDGSYLAVVCAGRRHYRRVGPDQGLELCVWRTADKEAITGRMVSDFVEALAWSPDGRWLAVLLEPLDAFREGSTRLVIHRMGPTGG